MDSYHKPLRLPESIAQNIRNDIIKGYYSPGQRLKIVELSRRFGVSQTTAREALKNLEKSDLVNEIPHKGYVVTLVTIEELLDIWTIKESLWGLAFQWFTERASESLIKEAKSHVEAFRKAYINEDIDAAFEANFSFTDVIVKGCGSKKLKNLLCSIEDQVKQYRYRTMKIDDNLKISSWYFSETMIAIEHRDSTRASELIKEYIRFSKTMLEQYFESVISCNKQRTVKK